MAPERNEQTMHEKLERIEEQVRSLSNITHDQARMITTQSDLAQQQTETINKMWNDIQPMVANREKAEKLRADVYAKIVSAGIWGLVTGTLLLLWQGFKHFVKGDM